MALYTRFQAGEVSPEEMVAVLPRIWRSRSALDPLGDAAAWRAMAAHAGYFTWRSGQLQGRRARRPWWSQRLFRGAVPGRRWGLSWTADPAIAEHFARYRQPLEDGEGRVWTAVFPRGRLLAYLHDEREYLVDADGVNVAPWPAGDPAPRWAPRA